MQSVFKIEENKDSNEEEQPKEREIVGILRIKKQMKKIEMKELKTREKSIILKEKKRKRISIEREEEENELRMVSIEREIMCTQWSN